MHRNSVARAYPEVPATTRLLLHLREAASHVDFFCQRSKSSFPRWTCSVWQSLSREAMHDGSWATHRTSIASGITVLYLSSTQLLLTAPGTSMVHILAVHPFPCTLHGICSTLALPIVQLRVMLLRSAWHAVRRRRRSVAVRRISRSGRIRRATTTIRRRTTPWSTAATTTSHAR